MQVAVDMVMVASIGAEDYWYWCNKDQLGRVVEPMVQMAATVQEIFDLQQGSFAIDIPRAVAA